MQQHMQRLNVSEDALTVEQKFKLQRKPFQQLAYHLHLN